VLCPPDSQILKQATEDISAGFEKSPYYKGNITENQTYIISIGVQIKPVKTRHINTNKIEMIPEKSLAYFSGQSYALLKPDNSGPRIIGKGIFQ
jgi:selenocysteine-specific translation elongation factor